MIQIESKGNQIFLFGRNEDGEVYCKQKDFRPYFYVEDDQGEFVSIDGKKLKKVNCVYPYEVPQKRQSYLNHYEADILYPNRYIIDEIEEIKEEPIRKCYIDIETEKPKDGFDQPYKATGKILMVGCYDSFDKEKKRFILKDYKDEREMMIDFVKYIKNKDPDMLISWNGDNFDFPYIVNRLCKLKINPNALARTTNKFKGIVIRPDEKRKQTKIEGRILFDLMYAYKKWTSGEGRESFGLDYISKYEGVGEKEEYRGTLDDLYNNDIEKFTSYNDKDVELLVVLDEKLKLVDFFNTLRRMCFCKFEDVFMNSKIADCLCLKYAKHHKFVLPSVSFHKSKKYQGGFVQESIPGLHKMVACLDMKSLYPSLMIGFNLSYETFLPEYKEGCISILDKYYFKKEEGIIPSIVKPLLDRRAKVKEEVKSIQDRNSREYKTKYMEQYSLKTIANAFYGVLGYPRFRLYKREVASCITYLARMTIKEVKRWFEEEGYKGIYGDTDSVFVKMNESRIEDFKKLTKKINTYFKKYFQQFNIEESNNMMELQFEKVYKTIFFKGNKGKGIKKKYAGILIWKDGKDCCEFDRKGFESRRSDTPSIGRKFLDDILEMIVQEKTQEEIEKYIDDFKEKLKQVPPEDIAIPIGISKPLHQYKNQIHARASRIANERHNAGIQMFDKIKYLYVKNDGRVIAFKSDRYLWNDYEIDYKKMELRIINLKVTPIFESLGWKSKYSINISKRKQKIKLLKDILKQNELW